MQTITAHPDGILTVDAGYQRPGLAAIHLLVRDGEVAIIDSGTNASLPRVLAALSAAKVTPDKVRWLLLTHIPTAYTAPRPRSLRSMLLQ